MTKHALSRYERTVVPWLPFLVFLGFYSATTGMAAVYFLTEPGRASLWKYLARDAAADAAIGTQTYLLLLFVPFGVGAVFAAIGIHIVRRAKWSGVIPEFITRLPPTSVAALHAMLFAASAYCFYKLHSVGALFPSDLGTGSYQENILRRVKLFDDLGFLFYAATYAIIPMTAVVFLARIEANRRRWYDVIGFLLAFAIFYLLVFHIYQKSHLLVFAIMLVTAALIARGALWFIPAVAAISFVAFMSFELVLSGTMTEDAKIAREHMEAQERVPAASTKPTKDPIQHLIDYGMRAISFRMATAFPYYVAEFGNPDERCGVEAHTVRRALGLPPSSCTIPTKVFAKMYPHIKWVTGYAPAAAHITAYGEVGLGWSVAVTAMSGLVLGLLGGITALGRGPLFVGFGAASCAFGYYLSQLPFVAAFTYHHGLIMFMLPVAVLFVVSLMPAALRQIPRAGG